MAKRIQKFLGEAPTFSEEGTGYLEGYASVFNVVDLQGEQVLPGAYARTISNRLEKGRIILMARHAGWGGDLSEAIGVIVEAREDAKGLWVKGQYLDTPYAQGIRNTARSLKEMGAKIGLSIGGNALWRDEIVEGKAVPSLYEIKLDEITLTLFPANTESLVESAKSTSRPEDAPPDGQLAPPETLPEGLLLAAKTRAWLALQEVQTTLRSNNK